MQRFGIGSKSIRFGLRLAGMNAVIIVDKRRSVRFSKRSGAQPGNTSTPVRTRRVGVRDAVIGGLDGESGEPALGLVNFEPIARPLLALLVEPFRLDARRRTRLDATVEDIDFLWVR
jgi:hypothetical protein